MSDYMKLIPIFMGLIALWLTINFFPFIVGLLDGINETCRDSLARSEYIFPGYKTGCYLMGNYISE